ncbi:nitroreductase family protein [Microbacter margulisiae]|uniref:Nitroreductase n=1 Tax=Microbacter margulisiae TaxID=1350067 RepID=A0A7W5DSE6_9PORP|nr:nitroreductase family protein [Microbacter margulisiae]MBB3187898.1 nitroreductase [Microbacter margulisiae]
MSVLENLEWRYATKRMNGTPVPQAKLDTILEAIRMAPTSLGLQPFKVIVVEDAALREKIYNEACQQPQVKEGSHLLIFAAYTKITPQDVDEYMDLIAKTREVPVEALSDFKSMITSSLFNGEVQHYAWTARQAYIAFGIGIVAAAEEKVDATPMEGFSVEALDRVLDLTEKNLSAVTILALGYRDPETDYLANAKKVRKRGADLFIHLP